MSRLGQMSRNEPFTKYLHNAKERIEVPMHQHTNGQLNYVHQGSMRLISPGSVWVVPRQRIIWIPPDIPHSVQCEKLSGSWKIMTPRSFRKFLPKKISVLQTSELLVAALRSLPAEGASLAPAKLNALKEIIRLELHSATHEEFEVQLPTTKHFLTIAHAILKNPADPRRIDDWSEELGMSRRTFTRHFLEEMGRSFESWRQSLALSAALNLLSEGYSVSEVADKLGYSSPSSFIAAFRKNMEIRR